MSSWLFVSLCLDFLHWPLLGERRDTEPVPPSRGAHVTCLLITRPLYVFPSVCVLEKYTLVSLRVFVCMLSVRRQCAEIGLCSDPVLPLVFSLALCLGDAPCCGGEQPSDSSPSLSRPSPHGGNEDFLSLPPQCSLEAPTRSAIEASHPGGGTRAHRVVGVPGRPHQLCADQQRVRLAPPCS